MSTPTPCREGAQAKQRFTDFETQEGVGGMTLQFMDYTAQTSDMSYAYRVQVENDCGDSVGASNTAETIWLRGISDFTLLKNTLHWTPYADFPGATAGYRIYRKSNLGSATELLTTLAQRRSIRGKMMSAACFQSRGFLLFGGSYRCPPWTVRCASIMHFQMRRA